MMTPIMADQPKSLKDQPFDQAATVDLMAKSAAGMAAASMYGFSMMTQALGLWMGAVTRSMETDKAAESKARAPVDEVQPKAEPAAQPAKAKPTARRPRATRPAAIRSVASQPAAKAKHAPDDLKKIDGIGPKLEKVLNDLGISTYAQVAALRDSEIASIEDKLGFAGRVARDGWVGQAAALLKTRGEKA